MLTCAPIPSVSNTPKLYDPAVVLAQGIEYYSIGRKT